MILKIKREGSKEGSYSWEFRDGITSLDVEQEEISPTVKDSPGTIETWIHYSIHGDFVHQSLNTESYLLNDKGQTIERLY